MFLYSGVLQKIAQKNILTKIAHTIPLRIKPIHPLNTTKFVKTMAIVEASDTNSNAPKYCFI